MGVALLLHSGVLGNSGAQPLRVDHTKRWSYVRAPHRPATELERRLGDVAGLVARRPVQVRCEDFSDGTPLEPGGVVQFNGKQQADFARIRPDVCTRLLRFISAPRGAYDCVVRRSCNPSLADTAQALTVLAHESIHLRGVHNEAVTQCYARPCRRWRVRLERQRRTAALSHCWSTRWTIHICRPRIGRRSAIREDRWI